MRKTQRKRRLKDKRERERARVSREFVRRWPILKPTKLERRLWAALCEPAEDATK